MRFAVQDAWPTGAQRRRMLAALDAVTGRLNADHAHSLIVEEGVEQADCIRAAADAGDQRVRQPAPRLP